MSPPTTTTLDPVLVLAKLDRLESRLSTKLDSVIDVMSAQNSRLTALETAQKAHQEVDNRFLTQNWPDMLKDAKHLEERVRVLENQGAKFASYAGIAALAVSVAVSVALKLLHVS